MRKICISSTYMYRIYSFLINCELFSSISLTVEVRRTKLSSIVFCISRGKLIVYYDLYKTKHYNISNRSDKLVHGKSKDIALIYS